ncbi:MULTISPECIES: hypothetical protein [unclassified Leifsonia]|uniref:hypothetical protein n=1 Tax=unclassified Leifsonia TaxID=2663824 RepID=UPI0007018855|nr:MULTISPECIES: hypothetical protein [unclassified Leifsonia]KQX08500.1 hypothetical protein ASC59_08395 [Leifsonia sp. Root1293]KRA12785.1 hypothetical protein ASD61_08395 [Leifsonia sp. Root60]
MRWHPILAASEPEPGVWVLIDAQDHEYGRVTVVRVNGDVRFRAEFRGVLIGHGMTLRRACERVHYEFIRSHGPAPFQGYPDFKPK